MGILPLLLTAGYLLGTLVHAALLRLVARRPYRRPGEGILAALAGALVAWNGANLVRAFLELLTGREPHGIARVLDLVALPAIALAGSFTLHVFLVLRSRAIVSVKAGAVAYAPLAALLAAAIAFPAATGVLVAAWVALALLFAGAIADELARGADARPDALPATTWLYGALASTLGGAYLIATGVAVLLGSRLPRTSAAVELTLLAGSIGPTLAMTYAVYKAYGIRPVIRRGAADVAIALVALSVYMLLISTVSRALESAYGWNVRVVEGLGMVALVFVFQPFRRRVLESLSSVFDPKGAREVAVLRGLAADLTRPGASRPAELAARVVAGIQEALHLERAGLAIVPEPGAAVPASPPEWIDYPALLEAVAAARPAMLSPATIGDPALASQLIEAQVSHVRPLRYDGDLVGVLVLGRRADSTALEEEDFGAIEAIAGTLAGSCTRVRLFEQKLALERRLADAQRMAGLGRLSATVAHRVKNPLASIKAIAQAMREDLPPDARGRLDLTVVIDEVDTLSRVVSELLGFARGAPSGQPGPVDARKIAEDVILLMQHQASGAGVKIELRAVPFLPPVMAEPTALREVLANLVENAIIASPRAGEVVVEVEAAAPGRVRVRVADAGPGVPADIRGRLFEPFFTTRPGGTGLGLAVSRQRIEAWGGRIWLEDGGNGDGGGGAGGARFAFELRVAEGAE